jgi:RloB-like protein
VSQSTRGAKPERRTAQTAVGPRRSELLVFVEGVRTEVQYINLWYRRHRTGILVEISDTHGTPMTLVEAAIETRRSEQREERRGRGRAHDEYWCVFDRDEHPRFEEAVKLAQENQICLAVSNPCLELWFVWHFEDQTAHVERGEIQRRSRAILGCEKTLTEAALRELAGTVRYDAAKHRATRMDAKHQGDGSPPGSNPSSGTYHLVDRIRQSPG